MPSYRAQKILNFLYEGRRPPGYTPERLALPGVSDLLEGGAGNDHLTDGAGSDVFIFVRGQGGRDIITDFTPRTDLIRLVGYTAAEMQKMETVAGVLVSLPDAHPAAGAQALGA